MKSLPKDSKPCKHLGDKSDSHPQFCQKCGVEFMYARISTPDSKQEWAKEVKSWYRAYSEHEKLLVLNTQERMIDFISSLLSLQKQQIVEKLEEKIKENNKWKHGKEICMLCYEEDYCHHDIENEALQDAIKIVDNHGGKK
jgi:predicted Zn-ribbon and HTH transcriptional regulator